MVSSCKSWFQHLIQLPVFSLLHTISVCSNLCETEARKLVREGSYEPTPQELPCPSIIVDFLSRECQIKISAELLATFS